MASTLTKTLLGIATAICWVLFFDAILGINNVIQMMNEMEVTPSYTSDNPLENMFASMIMGIVLPTMDISVGIALLLPYLIRAGITLIVGIILSIVTLVKLIK